MKLIKPKIDVNYRLNELKNEAKGLLMSRKGLKHHRKRAIESETVFGQSKVTISSTPSHLF